MNFIDVLVAIVILWFSYKGFSKGLVVEITGLFAFVLGIYGGLKFSHLIAQQLTDNMEESYIPIVSFSLIFIGVVILVFLLGKLIEKVVNAASLNFINKITGAAFGGLKLAAILSILFTLFEGYDSKIHFIPQETKDNSLFYYPMLDLGEQVLPELERRNIVDDKNLMQLQNVTNI